MGFKKQIIINKDTVFRVKVEEINEFRDSFFYDTYLSAAKIVVDIINNTEEVNYKDSCNTYSVETDINNIIAFVGERGSGKTSVMASFAKSLKEKNKLKNNSSEFYEIYSKLRNENFLVESIIDPSIFTVKDSIVEIILAKMFNNFKNEIEQDDDIIKKQKLIRCFEKVYKDLRMINREKNKFYDENEDNLEVLLDLSSAISLKENLKKLVKEYLKFMKKSKLVIPIDDLDMRLDSASNMIEEIRKYLMQDNIIILMAIKFEQLDQILKEKNLQQYNILLKNYNERIIKDDIALKIEKYLEKIIPVNRRLHLPRIGINDVDIKFELNNSNYNNNLESLIYDLIKEKTLVEFNINDNNQYLIPNNLRGLIDFIVFLDSLQDVKNEDHLIITKNINKLIIFISNKFKNNTSKERYKEFIDEIIQIPYQFLNQKIIRYLGMLMLENDEIFKDSIITHNLKEYVKECCSSEVNYKNLSIGYVNQIINLFYDKSTEESERILISYIRLLYTLKLNVLLYEDGIDNGIYKIKEVIGGDIYGNWFSIYNNSNENSLKSSVQIYAENNELHKNLDIPYKFNKLEDLIYMSQLRSVLDKEMSQLSFVLDKENYKYIKNKRIFDKFTVYEEDYLINSKRKQYVFKPMNILNNYIYFEEFIGGFLSEIFIKDYIEIYKELKFKVSINDESEKHFIDILELKNFKNLIKKEGLDRKCVSEILSRKYKNDYYLFKEKRIKYIKKIINISDLSSNINKLIVHLMKYSPNNNFIGGGYRWYINRAHEFILGIENYKFENYIINKNIIISENNKIGTLGKLNKNSKFIGMNKEELKTLYDNIKRTRDYIEENRFTVMGSTINNKILQWIKNPNRDNNNKDIVRLIEDLGIRKNLLHLDEETDEYQNVIQNIIEILNNNIKYLEKLLEDK
ncbi:hypothetical protein QJR52_07785 [Clostridium baratii]|uniref:hypothetical protein n=1 Tax=Clostridium baratii TaxID=1561 RepID=UPI0030D1494F